MKNKYQRGGSHHVYSAPILTKGDGAKICVHHISKNKK